MTLSSELTKTLRVVREMGFTPTISTFAVAVSRWSAVRIFSRVCVGSSTRVLVSSLAERRSIITAGRPSPVLAARVLDEANDDRETTDAQLLLGLLTCVLGGVVSAFTDRDWTSSFRLAIPFCNSWTSLRDSVNSLRCLRVCL